MREKLVYRNILIGLVAAGMYRPPVESAPSAPEPLHRQAIQAQDTAAWLATTWALQQKIGFHPGQPDSVERAEGMELTFYPDGTYRLVQRNGTPNAVLGAETVEEGEWRLDTYKGLIGARTTRSNGLAIKSAMLYRWEITQIKPGKLILKQPAFGRQYLLFEEKRE